MLFNSAKFLFFFAVLFFVYFNIPKKMQWIVLLIFSAYFYCSVSIKIILYLGTTILTVHFAALIIHRNRIRKMKSVDQRNKMIMLCVLLLNIGVLAVVKYSAFVISGWDSLGQTVKILPQIPVPAIVMPLGISFYTFQSMGYLLDVYRGVCEAQSNIGKTALFISFFPTIIQGPICRYNEMAEQLYSGHSFDYRMAKFGLQRFLWGVFKKQAIADRIGTYVDYVYLQPAQCSGWELGMTCILYAFQIYTDFSGYMDMAIGIAQVLGITLPENFQTPFFSRSISEYWRRWHITLGSWFKDYLFYPILKSNAIQSIIRNLKPKIGKKKAKAAATHVGMGILWFTIGLWHGASWNFIIGSGLLHCFYIVGGEICEPAFAKLATFFRVNRESQGFHFIQQIRTFLLVCVGFVFFRAPDIPTAMLILQRILTDLLPVTGVSNSLAEAGFDSFFFMETAVFLLILLVVSALQQKISIREVLEKQDAIFRWGIYSGAVILTVFFSVWHFGAAANQFIYFNF